jgi:uncharacterized membrane protein YphA (DoxX/SURF4 family)
MARNLLARKDYATGTVVLSIIAIMLLPVGGIVVLGLLAPFIIVGLIVTTLASMITGHRR